MVHFPSWGTAAGIFTRQAHESRTRRVALPDHGSPDDDPQMTHVVLSPFLRPATQAGP